MEEEPTPAYKHGYNSGYLIAKHRPELSESLQQTKGKDEFVQGLKDGQNRFDKEKDQGKAKSPSKLDKYKGSSRKKSKGKEKGGRDR